MLIFRAWATCESTCIALFLESINSSLIPLKRALKDFKRLVTTGIFGDLNYHSAYQEGLILKSLQKYFLFTNNKTYRNITDYSYKSVLQFNSTVLVSDCYDVPVLLSVHLKRPQAI